MGSWRTIDNPATQRDPEDGQDVCQTNSGGVPVFKRILVGFDGSPQARGALHVAMGIAEATAGEVAAVTVVNHDRGDTEEDRTRAFDADAEPLRRQAEREVAMHPYGATHTVVKVVAGQNPARTLADFAYDHGYDVIVAGRHGHEQASHVGLGRVVRQLAETAHCPVLVVGERL
jgi:nucleotide-binding universal stress UspA family protein